MKRQTKMHRGYRIVVLQIGRSWTGIVYAPDGHIVAKDIEGDTAQEARVKAMRIVDARLAQR